MSLSVFFYKGRHHKGGRQYIDPYLLPGSPVLDLCRDFIQLSQHWQDPGLKPAALMGQLTVFSISPHQLHLELLFQRLHCFADGRLGHMKILGRHGNVLISCRPRKISQLVKLHTLPLSFSKTRGRNPVPPLVCITFC